MWCPHLRENISSQGCPQHRLINLGKEILGGCVISPIAPEHCYGVHNERVPTRSHVRYPFYNASKKHRTTKKEETWKTTWEQKSPSKYNVD